MRGLSVTVWRWIKAALRLLLALLILFEEWGWEPLQALMARLARLPALRRLEAWIVHLPPWGALPVFALPALMLLPVKIGALWLVAQGRPLAGLALIAAAKLVGTALAARLFTLTQPALMRMAWFARLHARWTVWKDQLLAWVRGSALWQAAHAWRVQLREALRRWRARWFGPR